MFAYVILSDTLVFEILGRLPYHYHLSGRTPPSGTATLYQRSKKMVLGAPSADISIIKGSPKKLNESR